MRHMSDQQLVSWLLKEWSHVAPFGPDAVSLGAAAMAVGLIRAKQRQEAVTLLTSRFEAATLPLTCDYCQRIVYARDASVIPCGLFLCVDCLATSLCVPVFDSVKALVLEARKADASRCRVIAARLLELCDVALLPSGEIAIDVAFTSVVSITKSTHTRLFNLLLKEAASRDWPR